jgi:uncharacterized membrane protein YsdA (DUF1294 family)
VPPRSDRRGGKSRARVGATACVVLLALLIIPFCALCKLSGFLDWRGVAGYACVISLGMWFLYRKDKQQAEAGGWRTPEVTLHAIEVFGGWPAAFLAQRWYRHKIAKRIYQINFWAIVVLHQFVAFDYLQDWRFSQAALARLNPEQLFN